MSGSKQSAHDLIESIANETPIEFYDQALAQHSRLRKDIQSLIYVIPDDTYIRDGIVVVGRPYRDYSIGSSSGYPQSIYDSLKSLESVADSLDRKHGAALKGFAIAAISELANSLDVDEISEKELLIRLRGLKQACERSIVALKRKRDSLELAPSAGGMTRQDAIAIMRKAYDELPRTNPESDMEALANSNFAVASFVKQIDWKDILGISVRTISKWSIWKRLDKFSKERRASLKSTLPGGEGGPATDDAENE